MRGSPGVVTASWDQWITGEAAGTSAASGMGKMALDSSIPAAEPVRARVGLVVATPTPKLALALGCGLRAKVVGNCDGRGLFQDTGGNLKFQVPSRYRFWLRHVSSRK